MLALLMQESLEESSALDSCAVTRMRGRTASPGARRQDCGQAQVLPLGHTFPPQSNLPWHKRIIHWYVHILVLNINLPCSRGW